MKKIYIYIYITKGVDTIQRGRERERERERERDEMVGVWAGDIKHYLRMKFTMTYCCCPTL